jgi:DNA-binding NarL/FixJ family response regulator
MADPAEGAARAGSIRLIIVDDDLFVRSSLTRMLQREPQLEVVGSFSDGAEAAAVVAANAPDVALIDIRMPTMDGPEVTRRILAAAPSVRVVALTSLTDDQSAAQMLAAGAVGFLAKDTAVSAMVHAIQSAADGLAVFSAPISATALAKLSVPAQQTLTSIEAQVLRLVCAGRTNEEIGREVYLSASTVKQQVTALMDKLGASNRVTLAVRAAESGLN